MHAFEVGFPCAAFHVVADEIADEQIFIAEREEAVGEVIHGIWKIEVGKYEALKVGI